MGFKGHVFKFNKLTNYLEECTIFALEIPRILLERHLKLPAFSKFNIDLKVKVCKSGECSICIISFWRKALWPRQGVTHVKLAINTLPPSNEVEEDLGLSQGGKAKKDLCADKQYRNSEPLCVIC